MSETPAQRAVVDRIEGDLAVLLVGDREEEHHVPAARLPDGAGEGTWLLVSTAGELRVLGLDPDGEAAQRDRVADRLEQLRGRRRRFR